MKMALLLGLGMMKQKNSHACWSEMKEQEREKKMSLGYFSSTKGTR